MIENKEIVSKSVRACFAVGAFLLACTMRSYENKWLFARKRRKTHPEIQLRTACNSCVYRPFRQKLVAGLVANIRSCKVYPYGDYSVSLRQIFLQLTVDSFLRST